MLAESRTRDGGVRPFGLRDQLCVYWPYLEVFLSSMVAYRFLPPYIYLISRQTSFSVAPAADLLNTTAWGG